MAGFPCQINEQHTSNWGDWLDDEAIDMEMVEDVESMHKPEETLIEAPEDDSSRVIILECCGSSRLSNSIGEGSCLGQGCLSALLQQRCVCPWLKRLCDGDPTEQAIPHDAAVWPPIVFGAPCTLDLMLYNRHHFINAIRQSVFSIEQRCSSRQFGGGDTQHAGGGEEIFQLRLQVVTFYNCLWGLVNYHLCNDVMTPENATECGRVAYDVLELLQCVGPLHLLPQHVTAATSAQGNRCASTAYHLFHLHLDLRWWSLAILHTLEGWSGASSQHVSHPRLPQLVREPLPAGSGEGEAAAAHHHTALGQALAFVTWDLMILMAREAAKSDTLSLDAEAGLPCSCCHELAVTVLHLTQHRHQAGRGQSYWDTIRSVFVLLLSNQDTGRGGGGASSLLANETATAGADQYPPSELRGLSCTTLFRLLLAAARLRCYDEAGHMIHRSDPRIIAEPRLLRDLIQSLLGEKPSLLRNMSQLSTSSNSSGNNSSAGSSNASIRGSTLPLTEERLRPALRCCLLLTVLWEGEPRAMDWAMLLWEKLFAKRLGSSFLLGGAAAVQELASISPRISGWVSAAQQRCHDPTDAPPQESSWLLFLRIIGCVVRRGGDKAWLIVKGRVLSKFSSRRLADLCSTGLRNLALMLLTLAHCSAMRDTAELASELLCQSVPANAPSGSDGTHNSKLVMVVRSVLALALMLAQAGCDASQVLAPLTRLMAPLAQQFASNREVSFQREAGRVLGVYFTASGELCALSTDLSLGQRSLYAPWLQGVVSACSGTELQQLLHGLHQALASVLHLAARHRSLDAACLTAHQVVASIDRGVGVFLRTHSTSVSPPPELSAVAAALTLAHASLAPAVTTLPSSEERVGPGQDPAASGAWPSRGVVAGGASSGSYSAGNQSSERTESGGSRSNSYNSQSSFYRTKSDNGALNNSVSGVDSAAVKSSSAAVNQNGGAEYKVNHKEAASSMFSYFLTTEHVNTDFSIEYMSGLFISTPSSAFSFTAPDQDVLHPALPVTISSVMVAPQQQEVLVARLVRCAALRGSECSSLLALLPHVCSLSLVSHYLPSSPPACPLTAVAALVKGMAREHALATSVQSKHRVQSCCVSVLSGVERAVQSVVQQTPPPPHLQQLLQTLGDMVRHAAALLYVKSKGANCPLACLLTCSVLSSASYRLDRPLPPHIVHGLGPVLPQVLHGLCSLPLEQDTFLSRLTRTVITNYMHRYPANRHPFVIALCVADTTGSSNFIRRLRALFVDVLRTDFFGHKWEGDYSRLQSALQVVALVLRRVGGADGGLAASEAFDREANESEWACAAALTLLPLVLQLLLAAEDKTTKNCSIELLRIVFTLTDKHDQPDRRAVAGAVEGLVQQRLCWQSERVFQLLSVLSALQPRLVADCLPAVRAAVRQTEEKRGTGVDQKLRQQYKNLEQRVGNQITSTASERTPLSTIQ